MRRFYSPPSNYTGQNVSLDADETRHLRDVLRLRAGNETRVFDGEGKEFLCRIVEIGKKETRLDIIEKIAPTAPESALDLTLAVALLKGEKFDLVVQKACELGVSRFMPLITKRADVKIKDAADAAKKLERWRRIVLESSKQTGRARLMQIETPVVYEKFVESAAGVRVLFAERGGEKFESLIEKSSKPEKITALVGAEGGWEDAEIELARARGFHTVTLGGRILRAETAAIAIPALLQNHFGDLK